MGKCLAVYKLKGLIEFDRVYLEKATSKKLKVSI
jgi:hypothetical protein